jgi:hypothetical protein
VSVSSPERHFTISAHITPQGPQGQYKATYGTGPSAIGYEGKVTCIKVEPTATGTSAMVGIKITKSTHPEATVGGGEFIRVTDRGQPSDPAPKDTLSPGEFTATPPTECKEPVEVTWTHNSGNFVAHDGD